MRAATFGLLICLTLGGCFSERGVDDVRPFVGCYATDELVARVNMASVWLSIPGQTYPAHVGEDKRGYYLLVERPVRYEQATNGGLRLETYRGTGTYFRFLGTPPNSQLQTFVGGRGYVTLSKARCEALGLT